MSASYLLGLGLLHNMWQYRFILGIHPLDWLGLSVETSIVAAVFGWCVAWLRNSVGWAMASAAWFILNSRNGKLINWTKYIALPILLTICTHLISPALPMNIPWASTGILSGSILNIGLSGLALQFSSGIKSWKLLILFACLALCSFTVDEFIPAKEPITIKTLDVTALQMNNSPEASRLQKSSPEEYLRLLATSNSTDSQIVIFPEGIIPAGKASKTFARANELFPNTNWVMGGYSKDPNTGSTYNVAYVYDKLKRRIYVHRKHKLVPFGEYIPLREWIAPYADVLGLTELMKNSFSPGEIPQPIEVGGLKVGILICYEIAFPEVAANLAAQGAELLIVLGDTSWYHWANNIVKKTMMLHAKHRAAETGLPVIVVSNGGPLAVSNGRAMEASCRSYCINSNKRSRALRCSVPVASGSNSLIGNFLE